MKNETLIIRSFLERRQVATIAAVQAGRPFCFNCFYGFDPENWLLMFKSSPGSRQVSLFENGITVAGTILGEKTSLHFNAGAQFEGEVVEDEATQAKAAAMYYKQFPISMLIDGKVLVIKLSMVRMTQTQAGFRNKHHWLRDGEAF
ncbi:hypothetical protein [Chitinophaga caseinilytica]|uniref:Pyridoxamine 5'-phosphate oxidase putative domain-containing protein n=1 Tax=Chitinophaga caseinilytica TaxID=2267521 RepID=A0ABZ2YZI6_9BACT